jgi:thioredoxin-like negative regulator of GroEL
MLELSRQNFKEVVDQQTIVLIECWAPGCGVCAQFDAVFASVAERNQGHTFARMNVLTDEKLGEFFEIEYTPSIMLYRDGLLLLKKPGNFSEDALQDIVDQAESLDMAMVRADLESPPTISPQGRKENG